MNKPSCYECKHYWPEQERCKKDNQYLAHKAAGSCPHYLKARDIQSIPKGSCAACQELLWGYYCNYQQRAAANIKRRRTCPGYQKSE